MRTIQAAAVQQFQVHGFESVTVEAIAEETGVSASTVYRYFGTKEGLVIWDEQDAAVEAALSKHLGKHGPFDALRHSFLEAYSGLGPSGLEFLRKRANLIDAEPALVAAQVAAFDRDREELVKALAKVYRKRPNDLGLDLAVRFALAALVAGVERWQASVKKKPLRAWIEGAFDAAGNAMDS